MVRKINLQDCNGNTALHLACAQNTKAAVVCRNDNKGVVQILLRMGAKVGVQNHSGMTALHKAAEANAVDAINVLVNIVDDFNATDLFDDTPLHVASLNDNTAVVRVSLRMGAKVGVKNALKRSPLHYAVIKSAEDTVYVMVGNGERVNAKDSGGKTPLPLLDFINEHRSTVQCKIILLANIVNFLTIRETKINEQNCHLKTPYEELAMQFSIRSSEMEIIQDFFIAHVIMLKTLRLQEEFDINLRLGPDFYDNVRALCCKEFEDMKSTMILNDISPYQVFRHLNCPYLLSIDDLLHIDEFLCSPDLLTRYPLYGISLRTSFQRPKLLTVLFYRSALGGGSRW